MFEINRTKINGCCQLGSKAVTHHSRSDLPLVIKLFNKWLVGSLLALMDAIAQWASKTSGR